MVNGLFYILNLLLLAFCIDAYSQTSDSLNEKKWSVGISYSRDYCYRTIDADYATEFKKLRDSVDLQRWNGSFGIIASRRKWKNFQLQTGLIFSQKGFNSKAYVIKHDVGKFPGSMTIIDTVKDEFTYAYASLPLLIKYNIGKSRLKLTASTGILIDYLIDPDGYHNRGINTYDNSWVRGYSDVYERAIRHCISMSFKYGAQYEFNKKYSFAIEGSITHNLPVQRVQLYSYGIVGIMYFK